MYGALYRIYYETEKIERGNVEVNIAGLNKSTENRLNKAAQTQIKPTDKIELLDSDTHSAYSRGTTAQRYFIRQVSLWPLTEMS